MNGADVLGDALLLNGVDVCFANPGTSEMHFVAALDRRPRIRCVLGLFEGVVTAAADGYARMAEKPAATLLHTGPGLANGLANLHNARRARSPMINIVGDHATHHLVHDAPLTTDIDALARPMSTWLRRIAPGDDIGRVTGEAVRQAHERPGVSTLILPADVAWSEAATEVGHAAARSAPPSPSGEMVEAAVELIRSGGRIGLLLGGRALRGRALALAGRLATKTGVRLFSEMFNARAERGRGRVAVTKIPYPVDAALHLLGDLDALILVGSSVPVAFFAYPGKPSRLIPETCRVLEVAGPAHDLEATLLALAEGVGAAESGAGSSAPLLQDRPARPTGPLTADAVCALVSRALPEGAIVAEEALTAAPRFFAHSDGAAPHDVLQLTGGAIGVGIPLAAGAAVACPDRKIVNLQADGSGMYTVQGLWTQARERLDVVTVVLSNRAYAILQGEMANVGVTTVGRNATRMLTLDDPALDWVALARGLGVEAERATSVERLEALLDSAMRRPGPFLIEAVV